MHNKRIVLTLPADWCDKKLTPFFKKHHIDTPPGRNSFFLTAADTYMDTHPNSLTVSEGELTVLARKAANELRRINP